jgi:tetratricopeptide (TPR) repeat protein
MTSLTRLSAISLALLLTSNAALAECRYKPVADLAITYSWPALQPLIQGSVNGLPVSLMFNTASFSTFLTSRGALSKGLKPTPTKDRAAGLGGSTAMYAANVKEFAIGPSRNKNIEVAVLAATAYLDGYDGMVGADYAMQMDLEIAMADKKLRFYHATDCEQTWLGYWDQNAIVVPYFNEGWSDKRPRLTVELNGKKMVAIVNTAASHTTVYRKSAERAGITAQKGSAAFEFKLGDETVKNARLQIIDKPNAGSRADEEDMLLGQDWLRRHRILLSLHQRKAYFSYLGGDLFSEESGAPWYKEDAEAGVSTAQLALANYYQQRGKHSESDAWMQKALASGDPNAAYVVGTRLVVRRQFAQAVPLLQAARNKQPDNIQAALWLYLAQEKAEGEQAARSALAALPPARGEGWYAPVIDYYLGKTDVNDVKTRAEEKSNPRHACQAARFISLKEMLNDSGAKTANRDWTADWCQNVR